MADKRPAPPEPDWWAELFPARPHLKTPGARDMLRLIAYDIADHRRLRRVGRICEDHATRVQKSLFECWLDPPGFDRFWRELLAAIDPTEDRLVAYPLDAQAARARLTAGDAMQCSQRAGFFYVG